MARAQVTLIGAAMTAMGGALYRQHQVTSTRRRVSGIAISLEIVLALSAGGMFVRLGPTIGAAFTLVLAKRLRVAMGRVVHGLDRLRPAQGQSNGGPEAIRRRPA